MIKKATRIMLTANMIMIIKIIYNNEMTRTSNKIMMNRKNERLKRKSIWLKASTYTETLRTPTINQRIPSSSSSSSLTKSPGTDHLSPTKEPTFSLNSVQEYQSPFATTPPDNINIYESLSTQHKGRSTRRKHA